MRNLETLAVEDRGDGILLVAFNRPTVRNAINTQTCRDLLTVFGPLAFTPGDLRCVILTGTGDNAFSAGGDLKERQGMSDDEWRLQHSIIEESAYAILHSSVPVIASVNGAAFGGGCELALCCDFIIASRNALFALPEVTRGIMPGAGGTQNLPRAVGERRAKQIALTGEPFGAEDALHWGMVNEIVEQAALSTRTLEIARQIARNAPISVRQIKKAIHLGLQCDLRSGLQIEVEAYGRTIGTEDRREGVNAFNEKRAPVFKGR
jgi:enoyl-CoA hydratase